MKEYGKNVVNPTTLKQIHTSGKRWLRDCNQCQNTPIMLRQLIRLV